MTIKNLGLLLDEQAKVEIHSWFNQCRGENEEEDRKRLVNNPIIQKYSHEGTSPDAFRELVDCVSAFFTCYKVQPIGDNHRESSWNPERHLKYLAILNEPLIKTAVDRFYRGNEKQVKDLVKGSLELIFHCGEQVGPRELESSFKTVGPWTTYLRPEEIASAVEVAMMADLTYLVADNLTLGHLQTPTPLLAVFDEGIAQEKDKIKKEVLQRQRDDWAREDKRVKQNNYQCFQPGYQSLLGSFTRKMQFLKEILGVNYRPEIFKEIMGSEEFGDIETPTYFRRFFDGNKK